MPVSRCGIESIVLTLGVTSSPVRAVAAGQRPDQPALLVEQVDREAVDLELAQQVGRLDAVAGQPGVPGLELLVGERVVEALHPLQVVDRGELGRDRAADLLGRRVRGPQLGELLLERLEPAQPLVEVGVVEGRVVEDVVAPARVLDLLADAAGARRAPRGVAWLGSLTRAHHACGHRHLCEAPIPGPVWYESDTVAGPDLTRIRRALDPRAVVLLLHGGKERSDEPVDGRSASWRRMAAVQRAVTPAAHEAGASTWLLQLPGPRLERRRAGRRRPLGPRRGTPRARRRPGRAARPLDGWPHRRPRRRRPVGAWAWSRWRRGSRRASPSRAWPAGPCGPPTAAPTGSPRPGPPGRTSSARARPGPTRPSPTWAGSATTCSAGSRRGTGSPPSSRSR